MNDHLVASRPGYESPGHPPLSGICSVGKRDLLDVLLAASFADEVEGVAVGGPTRVVVVFGV